MPSSSSFIGTKLLTFLLVPLVGILIYHQYAASSKHNNTTTSWLSSSIFLDMSDWIFWPKNNIHYEDDILIVNINDSTNIQLIRRGDTKHRVLRIVGTNRCDIMRGLGYGHARDRLIQMLFLKSTAEGRLSEDWIDNTKTRKIDMIMRESQFRKISQRAIQLLDKQTLQELQYYSDGINAYIDRNPLPFDLHLVVGFDPRDIQWSPVDCLMSMHVMSVLGLADMHLHVEKFIIEAIHSNRVSINRLQTLFEPFLDGLTDSIQVEGSEGDGDETTTTTTIVDILRQTYIGKSVLADDISFAGEFMPMEGLGSNSWVVNSQHTKSKMGPILCTDPHLDTGRLPAIWYQVETIETNSTTSSSAGSHTFGITMPGLPSLAMGRNKNISIGFTYGFGDYYDYFIEKIKDGKYLKRVVVVEDDVDGEDGNNRSSNRTTTTTTTQIWEPLDETRHKIKTKNGDEFDIVTFSTWNGILDLDSIVVKIDDDDDEKTTSSLAKQYLSDGYYLSRSVSLTEEYLASGIEGGMKLRDSKTTEEAIDHAAKVCLSLNYVVADVDGNIAYQQSGAMPNRPEASSGLHPLIGWKEENRWRGHLKPNELVRVVNPEDGMIVSANNDVIDMLDDDPTRRKQHRPLNLHMGSYRRERILSLLQSQSNHTIQSMRSIQTDTGAPDRLRVALMGILKPELQRKVEANNSRSANALATWDGRFDANSIGALVFERTYRRIMDAIYGDIVFGQDVWSHIQSQTDMFKMFASFFDRPIFFAPSKGDDDPLKVFTNESKEDLIIRILNVVIDELDSSSKPVSWGEANEYYMKNLLFQDKFPFAQIGYSYGPVPMVGGLAVISQAVSTQQNGRSKVFSPSWRFISDLGNNSVATSLPGGPSGNRFDGYLYVTGIKEHIHGRYDYFSLS